MTQFDFALCVGLMRSRLSCYRYVICCGLPIQFTVFFRTRLRSQWTQAAAQRYEVRKDFQHCLLPTLPYGVHCLIVSLCLPPCSPYPKPYTYTKPHCYRYHPTDNNEPKTAETHAITKSRHLVLKKSGGAVAPTIFFIFFIIFADGAARSRSLGAFP